MSGGRKDSTTSFKKMFLLDEKLFNKLTTQSQPTGASADAGAAGGSILPPAPMPPPPPPPSPDDKVHENDILIEPTAGGAVGDAATGPDQVVMESSSRDVTGDRHLSPAAPAPGKSKLTIESPQAENLMQDLSDKTPPPGPGGSTDPPQPSSPSAAAGVSKPSETDACTTNCQLCGEEVSNLSALNDHFGQVHSSSNKILENECKICKVYFDTKYQLHKHIEKVHEHQQNTRKRKLDDDDDDDDEFVIDDDDDVDDDDFDSLIRQPVKKKSRGEGVSSRVSTGGGGAVFSCKLCNKVYKKKQTLENHMRTKHQVDDNVEKARADVDGDDAQPLANMFQRARAGGKRKIFDITGGASEDDSELAMKRLKRLKQRK